MSNPAIAAFVERHALSTFAAGELEHLVGSLAHASLAEQTWADPQEVDSTREPAVREAERYRDLGPIGAGGMGEVRRVHDAHLNRDVAMKTLLPRTATHSSAVARFTAEAQATAQLQHPNIVPVYDAGVDDNGRAWFTMREIQGSSLARAIEELYAGRGGWSFRRLLAAFLQVCNAVAYAHARGVIHRDLKPENILLGEHGEVYVLDWGLAKLVDWDHATDDRVHTDRERSGASRTRVGAITGTPLYMAPEQARGAVDAVGPHSDVYGLGAVLYELLTGHPPFEGLDVHEVLLRVATGDRLPMAEAAVRMPDLVAACNRAMAMEPADRFPSVSALAAELEAWLDGARRREQALDMVARARADEDRPHQLRERATALRAEGSALLAGIAQWQPEEDKAPGWAMEDKADALAREADLAELRIDQTLQAALRVDPVLPEAHAALAERYRARHAAAEAGRDFDRAAREEVLLRAHTEALPPTNPTRSRCVAWLTGDGALTLVTDPPGAEVTLARYETRNRRLIEVPVGSLGATPLEAVAVPRGSYVAHIHHPDRDAVRYPFEIGRLAHWSGVAPGETTPTPIWLPPRGWLSADEVYVPAGWFKAGGDPQALRTSPEAQLWADAFVIQRFPVTNAGFVEFLNDLVARGQVEEALGYAPRARAERNDTQGPQVYGFDGEHFFLTRDAEDIEWQPDWPVLLVTWSAARAWTAWQAERTGRPWRLPDELEWEKAARGVDGRWFPWGDHLDPSWCHFTFSHRGRRLPASVDSYPVDCSPSGMRGAAGGALDWCLGADRAEPAVENQRVRPREAQEGLEVFGALRGGSWVNSAQFCRVANRSRNLHGKGAEVVSFRGAYPVQPALRRPR